MEGESFGMGTRMALLPAEPSELAHRFVGVQASTSLLNVPQSCTPCQAFRLVSCLLDALSNAPKGITPDSNEVQDYAGPITPSLMPRCWHVSCMWSGIQQAQYRAAHRSHFCPLLAMTGEVIRAKPFILSGACFAMESQIWPQIPVWLQVRFCRKVAPKQQCNICISNNIFKMVAQALSGSLVQASLASAARPAQQPKVHLLKQR